jgi:MFS family permease
MIPAAATAAPTRARHGVIGFAVTLAMITYIDRVCISQAAPLIRQDLALSPVQMGFVLSIFYWTYGIFEIPWGWLGDRIGPRKVLLRVVLCWSVFTAATGWTWNLVSLAATRALFGVGEAGCFPNLTKSFTTWLPPDERVRAQGILWLAARWSGAFTPILVVALIGLMSWRWTFVVFGLVGIVWAFFFDRWYRDDPRDHPGVNDAERALLPPSAGPAADRPPVPWKRILSSPRAWLLWAQYFFLAYAALFYVTWLPTYLIEVRKVGLEKGAWLAGFPLFFAGLGSLFCGSFLARLTGRTRNPARARRAMAIAGFAGSGLMTLLSPQIADDVLAMVVLGVAGFAGDLVMPPSWAAAMDLGGRFAGTLSGSMNTLGCLGGSLSPIVTAYVLEWSGQNWSLVFAMGAAAYFLGMLCWFFLDPVTPLDRDPKEALA